MAQILNPIQQPSFATPEELDELLLEGQRSGEPINVTQTLWTEIRTELQSKFPAERKAS